MHGETDQGNTVATKDIVAGMTTDIWFEDAPAELTKDLKRSLATSCQYGTPAQRGAHPNSCSVQPTEQQDPCRLRCSSMRKLPANDFA